MLKTVNKYGVELKLKKYIPLIKRISNDQIKSTDIKTYNGTYQPNCEHCNMICINMNKTRRFIIKIKEHEMLHSKTINQQLENSTIITVCT